MSEKELTTAKPHEVISHPDLDTLVQQREKVFGNLVEKLKPWLFEFGNWIFGGLIAFNLVIVAPLLTIGPGHPPILVSIAVFVCALPLSVSGLLVLKLTKDMSDGAINEVMRQAFADADVSIAEVPLPDSDENESLYKRRTDVGLRYSTRLVVLSVMLALLGMLGALWYIAWWIAAIFLAVVIISLLITLAVITRLLRPDTEAEKEMRQRLRDQRGGQRNERRTAK